MPQGGARGQNLGHLKNLFFSFIFLLCNQQVQFRVDFLPVSSEF